ncbi:MAG: PEPxxWA-CTERM sorting domain-containing protein [Thiobacillus sp.]|nr:PEPxxWA-CTERM sorting domain-containing protein [Thiobacillus sp.]
MRSSKTLQSTVLSFLCAFSALSAQAQLMQATVTGTVNYGSDFYSNSVLLGSNDGTSLVGLAASATIIYDAAGFEPNQYGGTYWNFTHSPNYPSFLGIVGQGPIISASFTVNGITLAMDTSGTYENAKLYVENPVGNNDNWSLYGGDRRFTWCPNDAQCIETVQLSASQGYGNDLFGGQHNFSPADAFTANPAAGRTIDAYVRLMQGATCPAGMCPEGRFDDTATHWVEFGIAGTQLTVTPVPEPETWAMLLIGIGLVGLKLRRTESHAIHL